MYQELINNLLSYPQRGQIKIGFDIKKKVFRLSTPIFASPNLCETIRSYVEARKDLVFRPHLTSYVINQDTVWLIQEIPVSFTKSRKDFEEFCHLSRHCHKMFLEMAAEDVYKNALYTQGD